MTTAPLVTDLVVLVRASLADLRDAGILSDFLDERGDPRGVLLRRRWKRWQTERAACEDNVRLAELHLSNDERQNRYSVRLYRLWNDLRVYGRRQRETFVTACRTAVKTSDRGFALYITWRFPEAQ